MWEKGDYLRWGPKEILKRPQCAFTESTGTIKSTRKLNTKELKKKQLKDTKAPSRSSSNYIISISTLSKPYPKGMSCKAFSGLAAANYPLLYSVFCNA